jgi:hypothetical protein
MLSAILLLAASSSNTEWTTVTRSSWDFKDPPIAMDSKAVPKDTPAAVIVVKQLTWRSLNPNLASLACEVMRYLEPMMDGFLRHLMVVEQDGRSAEGVLIDGCFNYSKQYATNSKLIWRTVYFLGGRYVTMDSTEHEWSKFFKEHTLSEPPRTLCSYLGIVKSK